MGLIANSLEAGDALFQRRVVQIGDTRLDGVIEPLKPQVGLRRALIEFGDMFAAAFGALLAAVEDGSEHFLQPLRLKQAVLDMAGDKVVELVHRDRTALAAGLTLPGLDGACVVPILAALAGAQRHRAAAVGAKADAGKESRTTDDPGWRHLRIARAQMRLHGFKGGLVDDRRHIDHDHLCLGL
ncbi:MAG: hypothetical protein WCE20_08030 [Rhizomicrobium sp.]